jgi:hypothetical protein
MFSSVSPKIAIESKKMQEQQEVQERKKNDFKIEDIIKNGVIREIIALPNERLLIHGIDADEKYLEIFDTNTRSSVKRIKTKDISRVRLLTDTEFVVHRFSGDVLLFDFNLNLLETIQKSCSFSQLVEFNKNILIGYVPYENLCGQFHRSNSVVGIELKTPEFNKPIASEKIDFLKPLGHDKIIIVCNTYLNIIEWRDKKFIRIAQINFENARILSVSKISEEHFIVCTAVRYSIHVKEKTPEMKHISVYDIHTLVCINTIVIPESAPVREVEMLPDGKTLIGWDPCVRLNEIYEVNIETHAQRAITLPGKVNQLKIASDGNIIVLLDFKHVKAIELKQIMSLKLKINAEKMLKLDSEQHRVFSANPRSSTMFPFFTCPVVPEDLRTEPTEVVQVTFHPSPNHSS